MAPGKMVSLVFDLGTQNITRHAYDFWPHLRKIFNVDQAQEQGHGNEPKNGESPSK
jgi:hypothetical protein